MIQLISTTIFICFLNYLFLKLFISFAKKSNIKSLENQRSLHKGSIPTGAGIILSVLFQLILLFFFFQSNEEKYIIISFIVTTSSCSILGFIDDLYDLNFLIKLFGQFFIVFTLLLLFNKLNPTFLSSNIFLNLLTIVVLVWILNSFNFIDGIDGFLTSISIIIFLSAAVDFQLKNNTGVMSQSLIFISSLLGIFLLFNWSPAKIFLGDAGSLFLGSIFCIIFLNSIQTDTASLFYYLIMVSYILVDTTITLIIRIWRQKSWFKAHNSHSYQNLTKILKSHSKTTIIISSYHLIWLFPIALCSSVFPEYETYLLIISILPSIIFVVLYGPLYRDD